MPDFRGWIGVPDRFLNPGAKEIPVFLPLMEVFFDPTKKVKTPNQNWDIVFSSLLDVQLDSTGFGICFINAQNYF